MDIALAVILASFFLASYLLDKVLRGVPAKELRRRARAQSDKKAAAVYKLSAFGLPAVFFLWAVGVLSVAGLVVLAADTAWWAGPAVAAAAVWLVWMKSPAARSHGWLFSTAALLAPLFSPLVSLLQPILGRTAKQLRRFGPVHYPTGIYEPEDLLEFLRVQARHPDNRIDVSRLKLTRGALSFEDEFVTEVMLPRRKVRWVAAADPISPMVMDELHETGQRRFPVVKEAVKSGTPEILGTLYINDLLNRLEDKGKVRDIMHPGAGFINESQNLRGALDGFLKSGQYLLVAVNNFEEVVGVITIEDVIERIFGQKLSTDSDGYGDIRAAASHGGGQSGGQPTKAEVE